jgi:hypothetical protein
MSNINDKNKFLVINTLLGHIGTCYSEIVSTQSQEQLKSLMSFFQFVFEVTNFSVRSFYNEKEIETLDPNALKAIKTIVTDRVAFLESFQIPDQTSDTDKTTLEGWKLENIKECQMVLELISPLVPVEEEKPLVELVDDNPTVIL